MEDQEKITIKTTTLKTTRSIRHDHLFKVVVLGDAKVGKTSLVAAFTGSNKFSEEYLPTLAVDFKTKVLSHNEKNIKLQIWDSDLSADRKVSPEMGQELAIRHQAPMSKCQP